MNIKLVVATRASEKDFYETTATGRSLAFNKLGRASGLSVRLFPDNKRGLPEVYNEAIRECRDEPCILVFAHDDLHLLDFYWGGRIHDGLEHFQILGLAGNTRRLPRQPSWAFVDTRFTWDKREFLSGIVGHGNGFPPRNLSIFGAPRQKVKLLDGLLLACRSELLIDNDLFFDQRFDFHFYDCDFCRQAEAKDISCGTWDVSVVHESKGGFGSPAWQTGYRQYLEKWGD